MTWNDYNEKTCFNPVNDPKTTYGGALEFGSDYYMCHEGYTKLASYYIQWYKAGSQPQITDDRLFWLYRIHSSSLRCSDPLGRTPVSPNPADNIYVTTMLKSPAELRIITGGTTRTLNVGAGIVHTAAPFSAGSQVFELWRGGSRLLQKTGHAIKSSITEYDYSFTSGYGIYTAPTRTRSQRSLTITKFHGSPLSTGSAEMFDLKGSRVNASRASRNRTGVYVAAKGAGACLIAPCGAQ